MRCGELAVPPIGGGSELGYSPVGNLVEQGVRQIVEEVALGSLVTQLVGGRRCGSECPRVVRLSRDNQIVFSAC